jgi:hypothetical protein
MAMRMTAERSYAAGAPSTIAELKPSGIGMSVTTDNISSGSNSRMSVLIVPSCRSALAARKLINRLSCQLSHAACHT